MINWKVRVKNKNFWLAFIPAVLLLVQTVAGAFGYTVEVAGISQQLIGVVNALFAVLAILGIVTDPTTDGISDSKQAMTYEEPRRD